MRFTQSSAHPSCSFMLVLVKATSDRNVCNQCAGDLVLAFVSSGSRLDPARDGGGKERFLTVGDRLKDGCVPEPAATSAIGTGLDRMPPGDTAEFGTGDDADAATAVEPRPRGAGTSDSAISASPSCVAASSSSSPLLPTELSSLPSSSSGPAPPNVDKADRRGGLSSPKPSPWRL